ncbi:TRAP transporter substrate-binding protein [Candidatus Kaiserbacteria bacterium]|nr:TRAP transporter substrate-binding protein [Candidatus Kaiserbacteria bacterium]
MRRGMSILSAVGILAIIAIVVGGGIFFVRSSPAPVSSTQPVRVKWLIAHQPTSVFARATTVFADELSKESNGRMKLEVVMPQDVGVTVGDIPNTKVMQLLDSGDVEIATTYTVALSYKDAQLGALNLPFAFGSYDKLPTFLDGAIGSRLLDGIRATMPARGLAFTMSGGFRLIATKDKDIRTPADMKGLRVATSGGVVAEATLKALGATPVPLDLENGSASIDPKTIDGVETTYSRLSGVLGKESAYTKHINETYHSVFLTVILAGNAFYDSLSPEDQTALKKAALAAAQVERQDSIALGEQVKSQLQAQGSVITTLSPNARASFKAATESVYQELGPQIGPDIVQAIVTSQK